MRIYFSSDLHLHSTSHEQNERFLGFLENIPKSGDTLVLGGDIFDLFVGDKKIFRKRFAKILEAIRNVEKRACSVYYLEGNHDFHLKRIFRRQERLFVMQDDFELKWGRKTFWICHGDQIDKEDYGYRVLRYITRSIWFRSFLKSIPDGFVKYAGELSSKTSRKYNNIESLPMDRRERTKKLFRDYARGKIAEGYDFVFIGHSHQADQKQFQFSGRFGEYINLGFSSDKILYAEYCNESQKLNLKSYP